MYIYQGVWDAPKLQTKHTNSDTEVKTLLNLNPTSMKKITMLLLALSIGIVFVQAQRGPQMQRGQAMNPEARAEMMTRMMTQRLELSDEQMEKVHQVNMARTKHQALMAEKGQSEARKAEAMNKKAKAKQKGKAKKTEAVEEIEEVEIEIEEIPEEDFDKEIEKILTPEQRAKWDEMKKQRRPEGERGGQRPMGGGMNRGGGN